MNGPGTAITRANPNLGQPELNSHSPAPPATFPAGPDYRLSDLEELTGTPLWEIETILHTAAGRTFTRRASQWTPGTGLEVYLLGHEELHTAACRYLGHRLTGYHDRLHDWAAAYRAQGWPPEHPNTCWAAITVSWSPLAICSYDRLRR